MWRAPKARAEIFQSPHFLGRSYASAGNISVAPMRSTRYSKYVGGISIYWCKAKQSGHLATVSDYFPFIKVKYYFKL